MIQDEWGTRQTCWTKQPRFVWRWKVTETRLSTCKHASCFAKGISLVGNPCLLLSFESHNLKPISRYICLYTSTSMLGEHICNIVCLYGWMNGWMDGCVVKQAGCTVLLEQIAHGSVDALINLGCCFYKVWKLERKGNGNTCCCCCLHPLHPKMDGWIDGCQFH